MNLSLRERLRCVKASIYLRLITLFFLDSLLILFLVFTYFSIFFLFDFWRCLIQSYAYPISASRSSLLFVKTQSLVYSEEFLFKFRKVFYVPKLFSNGHYKSGKESASITSIRFSQQISSGLFHPWQFCLYVYLLHLWE